MKKLVYILFVMILCGGCNQYPEVHIPSYKHVFSTYYGDIDIDTMEITLRDTDDTPCYTVKVIEKDSVVILGTTKYLPCPEVIYYCPSNNTYFMGFPDNHGKEVIVDYAPSTQDIN